MNPFFEERLNIAHDLIDNRQFDRAIEIIQNLKTRIYEINLLSQIDIFSSEVEKEYSKRYNAISVEGGDPTKSYENVYNLQKWRASEYLHYYGKLFREHEII